MDNEPVFSQTANIIFNPRSFGAWVRKMRKKRKYTLRQLAAAVGYSTGWVCEFEKGRRGVRMSDPLFFMKLADYLQIPLDNVLTAAQLPKRVYEEKYVRVYQQIRNKTKATLIVESITEIEKNISQLMSSNSLAGKNRDMVERLSIEMTKIKTALEIN